MKDTLVQLINESYAALAVAFFGGIVSVFNSKKRMTVKQTIGGLLTALFVGFIIDTGLKYYGANEQIRVMAVAMGGYCARDIMDIFSRKFLKSVEDKIGYK